ncbi:MAG: hypothetical protein ACYC5Y_05040 [Symbiobacteriia bacterium]
MAGKDELRRWADNLRLAADHLDGCLIVGGVLYEAAKREVKRVDDEMYAAHCEKARDAWDRALGKGAERVG